MRGFSRRTEGKSDQEATEIKDMTVQTAAVTVADDDDDADIPDVETFDVSKDNIDHDKVNMHVLCVYACACA